ncbi:MAG: rhodanese-like domain-containing protein [Sediminibacterium sp.]|jgi:glyoxylase-like metal-dependent hydrolase (beta-lactamase superfamily II)/rhodanese-related sulfurtransferase|nr:rhodanese-like domain-containing protein [Sediminibacterium sp.]
MHIQQLYTSCLSEAAYYIESNGEAAIIDPLRDIDTYLALASERNATIKYIFETHFHADFVSGHLDLAAATGAPIVYGPNTVTSFPIHLAKDGEVFQLGELTITVLHTPGHTLESTCYLLKDKDGKEHALFTGDTLFIGDVGRPDLAQKGAEITMQDLAGMMYESLQQKIMPLSDDVLIYPAHGAGSSCGKNLGPETFSTLGDQKKNNYALQAASKEAFIEAVTEGLAAPPPYFPINAQINKGGYESLETLLQQGLQPLTPKEVQALKDSTILLDTRHATVFTQGFVPGSISIGLEGRFAEWAGTLLSFDEPIVVIAEPGKEKESFIRLARVGFSKFAGFLQGGFAAWQEAGLPIDMIIDVEADELAMDIPHDPKLLILDVRKPNEFQAGHIQGAEHLPLADMTDVGTIGMIEDDNNVYVHCAGGYRSVIAASILKKQGFHNLRNVLGGWNAIKSFEDKFTFEVEEVKAS